MSRDCFDAKKAVCFSIGGPNSSKGNVSRTGNSKTGSLRHTWLRDAGFRNGGAKILKCVDRAELRFTWSVQGFVGYIELLRFERDVVMSNRRLIMASRRLFAGMRATIRDVPGPPNSSWMCRTISHQTCKSYHGLISSLGKMIERHPERVITIRWFDPAISLVGCFAELDSNIRAELLNHTPLAESLIELVLGFRNVREILVSPDEQAALYQVPFAHI